MKYLYSLFLILSLSMSFTACDKKNTKVSEVHWDRDMCARCAMVVSDRHNTVQVKNPANGKTYMFDDIGCTILWFDEKKIPWANDAKIWITDAGDGQWIDAREAYYDTENTTPMAYGFSAHKTLESIDPTKEVVDFEEVVRRVREIGK